MRQELERPLFENAEVDQNAHAQLKQLASYLESARKLVELLKGGPETAAPTSPIHEPDEMTIQYRSAVKRANEAEVALAKLHREIDQIKARAQSSVREVQRLAYQDPLTNLANGHLIKEHLDNIPERFGEEVICLLLDIDRFFLVNQILGHELGDVLLVQVAERLSQLTGDRVAVGRTSEDEFAVVLSGVPSKEITERAAGLAERARSVLSAPFLIGGQKLDLTFSMGASTRPGRASSSQELLRQADLALAHIKRHGRAQYALFDEALHQGLQRDSMLEFQMRHGLENNEFFMEYLPLVWLNDEGTEAKPVGVEALIRWRHRVEGVLAPHQFLPMAEKTGLIVPIGEWVIHKTCRQLRAWTDQGVNLFVNINLSIRQLLDPGLADTVMNAVKEAGIDPASISFEVTESVANFDNVRIDEALNRLQSEGFSLAVDNFGEGYFSLERMARARFLKLSRKVVSGDIELCRKAVAVSTAMGMVPVGVGIETPEQARFLARLGCLMLQGYHFSAPQEPKEISDLFLSDKTWTV